jgi:formiminoglutamase
MMEWLEIHRGTVPLIVSLPHTGTDIPAAIEPLMTSPWLARKDADWWIDQLYDFAVGLGASMVRTRISRSVIDVNRDPSGASLYPGQATTELCPTTSFDGEPLYKEGLAPDAAEIGKRRTQYFAPYHAALQGEIDRLRAHHGTVVLYDAHSIRSKIPRLFDGLLPHFNIGDNRGATCAPGLTRGIEQICAQTGYDWVANGRFVGGWTTRHYGQPQNGVHAVQMELAMRGYLTEPDDVRPQNWPVPYQQERATALRSVLTQILTSLIAFADQQPSRPS